VTHTGTPVRTQFVPRDARECRAELGLDRERPVLLISGGSQGAEALNRVVIDGLSAFRREVPELQFVHITGKAGYREVREAHATSGTRACVRPFLEPMETAMGAATLALSRAGASSMAEMAAMRLPAILVPYPQAADDHQWFNAQAFVDMEAALCRAQAGLNSEWLVPAVAALVRDEDRLRKMKQALEGCYHPRAAERIAEAIRAGLARRGAQGFYAESDAGSAESPSQTREGRRTSSLQAV
jgi:UDP-N-acetylglucosamine--N-acetylmuramyl-(pentapeptide) pyrophosphoryl-undecaprenol N-acetylglucosamine transferase